MSLRHQNPTVGATDAVVVSSITDASLIEHEAVVTDLLDSTGTPQHWPGDAYQGGYVQDRDARELLEEILLVLMAQQKDDGTGAIGEPDDPLPVRVVSKAASIDPQIQTFRINYTTAQVDALVIDCPQGNCIAITRAMVTLDKNCSVNVSAILGFGNKTPTGVGVIASHPGIDPGGGFVAGTGEAAIAMGMMGQAVRATIGVPTGGSIDIVLTFMMLDSYPEGIPR